MGARARPAAPRGPWPGRRSSALGTNDNGVFILKYNFSLNYISEKEGLPNLNEIGVFSYFGKIHFSTEFGFYELSDNLEKTIPSKTLGQKNCAINRAFQIGNDIWYDYGAKDKTKEKFQKIAIISSYRNQFVFSNSYLNRIQNTSAKHFYKDSNSIYISTNQGLYKYELKEFIKPKRSQCVRVNISIFRCDVRIKTETKKNVCHIREEI